MELIANQTLYMGRGRTVVEGEVFSASRLEARDLLRRGYAREYETKVIAPEVPALTAPPFRDVPAPDPEPPALAALRAAVCSVPDVSAPGDPDSLQRRKRGRPRAK